MGTKENILAGLPYEAYYRGELGDLKPASGDNALARCCFHEDHNPSLSVNLKNGNYKCFACDAHGDWFSFHMLRHGVDFKAAMAAGAQLAGVDMEASGDNHPTGYLSLKLKEFALAKRFPEDFLKAQGVKENRFPDGVVSTDFHYLDAAGKLAAIRHRFANKGDKKFRWRKGDKAGAYGRQNLDKIKAAGWCLLVEGETDSLTCWLHELPALGMPGKKTWRSCKASLGKAGFEILQGVQVYLWEEPDAGVRNPKKPMEVLLRDEVAKDLPGLLVIPAPKEFKDLSEAHCQGKDIRLVVAELKKKARPPVPPPAATEELSLSDLGNARRLVALHGQDLRYCYLNKKWYFWTGKNWRVDDCGEVERRAKRVIAEIYREAADTDNLKRREALGQHALKSEEARRIRAMVSLAQSEPGIPVLPRDFDADYWLLNCDNGTIDLTTGRLLPHSRENLITCMAPVPFDPQAGTIEWEKFLYGIQDVRRQPAAADRMVVFLQRALGYAITGTTREQCLFILWGGGANGKSTLLNMVKEVLGNYAMHTPTETLLAKKRGGDIPTDVARLDGPRLVTASEVDRGRRLAESLVKELTGQDTVSARFLYGEYFDFKPQFKLFLSTNNKPVIRGADNAIWRRIKMIPFNVQFGEGKDLPLDPNLEEKLRAEAQGILAWLIQGCLYWQQGGLETPEEVTAAIAEYRAEMDVLAEFLVDCCITGPDKSVASNELYAAYKSWADEQGVGERERLGQRGFGLALTERGFLRDRSTHGRHVRRGLAILQSLTSPGENP